MCLAYELESRMMKNGHSGEFWTLSVGKLMCKSILCDFAMSVVYEIVAYDKGKLSVCSSCAFDEMVTCTRTSGHLAESDV